jgi:RimJ/RimL family protein N-acetyltransferase
MAKDHEFQAMYADEFSITLEDEYKFIDGYSNSENQLALVARKDGKVISMVNLQPISRFRKMSHIVSLGIGVLKEYRDCGLGLKLMEKAIDWIDKNTSYEKLEFSVLSTNKRAIHVYKKLGLQEEGQISKRFKFSEDDYRDDIVMGMFFKR